VITSYHDYLPAPKSGIMRANTPWSGYYEVQPPLWIIAHTTQFAEPGWTYLDSGCQHFSAISGLRKEGWSMVTLKSNHSNDYSIVIETMDAKEPQEVRFKLSGDLSRQDLGVWRSLFKKELFARQDDVVVRDGEFTLQMIPNAVYSLTTTRGQQKGEPAHAIPASRPFPLSFTADFEQGKVGQPGKFFSDLDGVFEVTRRPDGRGKCLKQTVTQQGIRWAGRYPQPKTIVGDIGWTDYQLSVDLLLPDAGTVRVWGRDHGFGAATSAGRLFEVKEDGSWSLKVEQSVLVSGKVKPLGTSWHYVDMAFKRDEITLVFDQQTLAKVNDPSAKAGLVGLGTDFNQAFFDNLRVSGL
jgi:galactosylceramidase